MIIDYNSEKLNKSKLCELQRLWFVQFFQIQNGSRDLPANQIIPIIIANLAQM
jgi:hypothetical protein